MHADRRYLDFQLLTLRAGERRQLALADREAAAVPLSGSGSAQVGESSFELSRRDAFRQMPSALYVPPGAPITLSAEDDWSIAIGSAPADGRHPLRLIEPAEMRVELRGGGAALRQVNHVLAAPLPAERLIVYEVYVPAGAWAGWPPHCHDGRHGSPYLEEVYLFGFDRPEGFGFHRNYLDDGSFDEVFTVHDGDCVAVPEGFHVTAASPGANMWILNFLAGELLDERRATPPYFDPAATWILEDWSAAALTLPAVTAAASASPDRRATARDRASTARQDTAETR